MLEALEELLWANLGNSLQRINILQRINFMWAWSHQSSRWALLTGCSEHCPSHVTHTNVANTHGWTWRIVKKGRKNHLLVDLREDLALDSTDGVVVKTPPANAGVMGSIPGPGISLMLWSNLAHAPQLLSPHSLEPLLCSKRSYCNEKPVHCQ